VSKIDNMSIHLDTVPALGRRTELAVADPGGGWGWIRPLGMVDFSRTSSCLLFITLLFDYFFNWLSYLSITV